MHGKRVGLWLIGAKGGVATTVITGLSALKRGTTGNAGLLTQTESFQKLGLVEFDQIVVGGHDIRPGSLADEARRMWSESRAITPDHLDGAQTILKRSRIDYVPARSWPPAKKFVNLPIHR